ncbi:MAG: 4-hydroxy-tetrahydrodipicolinate reductase [Clostridia bacterium]|nr:4-hydroxy-tetrahydrodipicolinate reductase [Clostridia bacterium]
MNSILLSGCNGKMGKFIANCVEQRDDCEIIAGIDISNKKNDCFEVFESINDFKKKADVIIDFSHPSSLEKLLEYAVSTNTPAVVATTGLSNEQIENIEEVSKKVPIFFSANMSLGVNLVRELAEKATKVLGSSFDIEIVEAHHNQKIDAPSGTALMLANSISEQLRTPPVYEFDRHSKRAKREKNEIGIHAIRGGTIVGEHEIIFAGHDEIIKISHSAMSKEIFATGSINAALFLCGKPAGLYSMSDLIDS